MSKHGNHKTQSMGLAVNDESAPVTVVELPVNVVPQGSQYRPHCTVHNCYMTPRGTQGGVTHYVCKVPGCECKQKVARAKTAIPNDPMPCPRVTCQEPQQYLEVDMNFLGQAKLRMKCPKCGHCVEVQRPAMASVKQQPTEPENISTR